MFALTPGEPAGIGPDLLIQLAQTTPMPVIVFGDAYALEQRACILNLPLRLHFVTKPFPTIPAPLGELYIYPISLNGPPSIPGTLNREHAAGVLNSLDAAIAACLSGACRGLITGPVHKSILHTPEAPFSGHTEYLAKQTQSPAVLMMFTAPDLPALALLTRHIPLHTVPAAITAEALHTTLSLFARGIAEISNCKQPRIGVLGLNPHAGEQGCIGTEEITILAPALDQFAENNQHIQLSGPLSPDSAFLPMTLNEVDGLLALYHDQGLGPFKALSRGHAVQVTIGLPFPRLSVDHGTALSLAGTGRADIGSFQAVLTLAQEIQIRWDNV